MNEKQRDIWNRERERERERERGKVFKTQFRFEQTSKKLIEASDKILF